MQKTGDIDVARELRVRGLQCPDREGSGRSDALIRAQHVPLPYTSLSANPKEDISLRRGLPRLVETGHEARQ